MCLSPLSLLRGFSFFLFFWVGRGFVFCSKEAGAEQRWMSMSKASREPHNLRYASLDITQPLSYLNTWTLENLRSGTGDMPGCVVVKYNLPYLVLNLAGLAGLESVTLLSHSPHLQRKNWANTHFLSGRWGDVHYWFYRYILSASVRIQNTPRDESQRAQSCVQRRKKVFLSSAQHGDHSSKYYFTPHSS